MLIGFIPVVSSVLIAHADFTIFAIAPTPDTGFKEGVVGQSYLLELQAPGSTAPNTWSITDGVLPAGLSLNASTGVISGTPETAGSFLFTVQVQDANNGIASQAYTLIVAPSVGGFLYARTPSGLTISNPLTVHLRGVFGADFCDSTNSAFILYATLHSSNNFNSIDGPSLGAAPGTVVDQDFTFQTLPAGTYTEIGLQCLGGSHSGQRVAFEGGSLTLENNHPPLLTPIGNRTADEGQSLSFTVNATDPDGDALTYSASNLPPGATFNPATRVFAWTPSFGQAGNYADIEFAVTDNGSPMQLAVELITISVGHVNRPPVFAPVGPQQASTTVPMSFLVSATDPDNDTVTLVAANMPSGAVFDSNTGAFSWTPSYNQAGVYTVTFTATDNGAPVIAASSLGVIITVSASSPTVLSENLIDDVTSSDLTTNQENSYLANLRKIVIFINEGKVQAAINQLDAFIQKVNQDYAQGTLTQIERDDFIGQAQAIIDVLQ